VWKRVALLRHLHQTAAAAAAAAAMVTMATMTTPPTIRPTHR